MWIYLFITFYPKYVNLLSFYQGYLCFLHILSTLSTISTVENSTPLPPFTSLDFKNVYAIIFHI